VSGVDAGGAVGGYNWRRFTLNTPPAATDPIPQLISPGDTATIAMDPNFSWTRMVGAADYRLIVSKEADFSPIYDSVICDYNTYTPYTAGTISNYPSGNFYWQVEARNSSNTVIATSNAWSFSKANKVYLPILIKDSP